tara:strand:+ start:996 stop:1523 length:528 start_codon:yes stop_codon:yes gene_type:complete
LRRKKVGVIRECQGGKKKMQGNILILGYVLPISLRLSGSDKLTIKDQPDSGNPNRFGVEHEDYGAMRVGEIELTTEGELNFRYDFEGQTFKIGTAPDGFDFDGANEGFYAVSSNIVKERGNKIIASVTLEDEEGLLSITVEVSGNGRTQVIGGDTESLLLSDMQYARNVARALYA